MESAGWLWMEGQSFERGRKKNVNVFLSNLSAQVATQRGERQTYTHINQAHPRFFFPTLVPSVFFYPLIHSITHTLTHTHAWLACTNGKLWSGRTHPATFDSNWPFAVRWTEQHTRTDTHSGKQHTQGSRFVDVIYLSWLSLFLVFVSSYRPLLSGSLHHG